MSHCQRPLQTSTAADEGIQLFDSALLEKVSLQQLQDSSSQKLDLDLRFSGRTVVHVLDVLLHKHIRFEMAAVQQKPMQTY